MKRASQKFGDAESSNLIHLTEKVFFFRLFAWFGSWKKDKISGIVLFVPFIPFILTLTEGMKRKIWACLSGWSKKAKKGWRVEKEENVPKHSSLHSKLQLYPFLTLWLSSFSRNKVDHESQRFGIRLIIWNKEVESIKRVDGRMDGVE